MTNVLCIRAEYQVSWEALLEWYDTSVRCMLYELEGGAQQYR